MGYTDTTRKNVISYLARNKECIFSEIMYLGKKKVQIKGETLHEILKDLENDNLVRITEIKNGERVVLIQIVYLK